jgi:hypothetical protein
VLTEVDHIDGVVLVESDINTHKETCWFVGEVASIAKGRVSLKIGKHYSAHAQSISDTFGGELWYMKDEHAEVPQYPVAFAESISSYERAKMDAMGVRGLITTKVFEEDVPFPIAQIKDTAVFAHVKQKQLSYCVTQAHHSTIIFYSL